jgi:hypothetical protein
MMLSLTALAFRYAAFSGEKEKKWLGWGGSIFECRTGSNFACHFHAMPMTFSFSAKPIPNLGRLDSLPNVI